MVRRCGCVGFVWCGMCGFVRCCVWCIWCVCVVCVVCVRCGVCGVCGAAWHAEKKPCEHLRAFCWYTRRRFERTHKDVSNLHTGGLSLLSFSLSSSSLAPFSSFVLFLVLLISLLVTLSFSARFSFFFFGESRHPATIRKNCASFERAAHNDTLARPCVSVKNGAQPEMFQLQTADSSISSASFTTADDVSTLSVDTLFLESSVSTQFPGALYRQLHEDWRL